MFLLEEFTKDEIDTLLGIFIEDQTELPFYKFIPDNFNYIKDINEITIDDMIILQPFDEAFSCNISSLFNLEYVDFLYFNILFINAFKDNKINNSLKNRYIYLLRNYGIVYNQLNASDPFSFDQTIMYDDYKNPTCIKFFSYIAYFLNNIEFEYVKLKDKIHQLKNNPKRVLNYFDFMTVYMNSNDYDRMKRFMRNVAYDYDCLFLGSVINIVKFFNKENKNKYIETNYNFFDSKFEKYKEIEKYLRHFFSEMVSLGFVDSQKFLDYYEGLKDLEFKNRLITNNTLELIKWKKEEPGEPGESELLDPFTVELNVKYNLTDKELKQITNNFINFTDSITYTSAAGAFVIKYNDGKYEKDRDLYQKAKIAAYRNDPYI